MLAAADLPLWWDRWSGPRRLANEEAPTDDIKQMLGKAIEHASAALIIRGPNWGASRNAAIFYGSALHAILTGEMEAWKMAG